jgi:isovaleryl-CoA dehydrogenase
MLWQGIDMNSTQMELKSFFNQYAKDQIAPESVNRDSDRSFCYDIWRNLADTGFFKIHIPKQYGGQGLGDEYFAAALEGLVEGCDDFSIVVSLIAHVALMQGALLKFGNEEQRQNYLPKLGSGEYVGSFAITEDHCGSDVVRISTNAQLSGENGYIINGQKWNITNAPVADLLIFFARSDHLKEKQNITAFICETNEDSIVRSSPFPLIGNRSTPTGSIKFNDHVLTDENIVGEAGGGIEVLRYAFLHERILAAIAINAYALPTYKSALSYSFKREAFNQPIAEFQYIQERLVSMRSNYEIARTMGYKALNKFCNGENASVEASIAKMNAAEWAFEGAKSAIQIFGNHGYKHDTPYSRRLLDSLGVTIAGGTAEIQKNAIWKEIKAELEAGREAELEAGPEAELEVGREAGLEVELEAEPAC